MRESLPIIIGIIVLCAWCPWISKEEAISIVERAADPKHTNLKNCTITPDPSTINKELFGYTEMVTYDCFLLNNESIANGQNKVYITFIKTLVNMPNPIIR